MYRGDFPNDPSVTDLFERTLKAIAARFSDTVVKVDTGVGNAARVWKVYGTHAAKGDHTEERPHRIARILELPPELTPVSREALEALAATVGPPPSSADKTFVQLVRPRR